MYGQEIKRDKLRLWRFAGGERGSRVSQEGLNMHRDGMRATHHAPRGPFRLLERLHSFPEIIERGTGVREEHISMNRPHQERKLMTFSKSSSHRRFSSEQ